MEIGPDEEMPVISEDAKLVKMLEGEEEIEKCADKFYEAKCRKEGKKVEE